MDKQDKQILRLVITVFFGWTGIQKFAVGRWQLGIAYLMTGGIFGIGWLYDICKTAMELFKGLTDAPEERPAGPEEPVGPKDL